MENSLKYNETKLTVWGEEQKDSDDKENKCSPPLSNLNCGNSLQKQKMKEQETKSMKMKYTDGLIQKLSTLPEDLQSSTEPIETKTKERVS